MGCGSSNLPQQQLNFLQAIVTKHVQDPSLLEVATSGDFQPTCLDRGFLRWEHGRLVAAIDVLNSYQRDRKAMSACGPAPVGHWDKNFKDDPRTRLIEVLKRWLRTHANTQSLDEDEVRGMCGLCRDVLNHQDMFTARNERSFMRTIAEVYEHFQAQLQDVLEKDRASARLMQQALSLGRNLISDAFCFLLLGPTSLRQTDDLASMEIVSLWSSLPQERTCLPSSGDSKSQRKMKGAWGSGIGSLLASVLTAPGCIRLFGGSCAEGEAAHAGQGRAGADAVRNHLNRLEAEFSQGSFKGSGLAGAFCGVAKRESWLRYLATVEALTDVVYLMGEVLVHFHRLGDSLGDYGVVRAAAWFHPCLDALSSKLVRLKANLASLSHEVDECYVIAKARGKAVEAPSPSKNMRARAHAAQERAVSSRGAHLSALLEAIEDLKSSSAPERLPGVAKGLGDACTALGTIFGSSEFRLCVGPAFPELPLLQASPHADARLRSPSNALDRPLLLGSPVSGEAGKVASPSLLRTIAARSDPLGSPAKASALADVCHAVQLPEHDELEELRAQVDSLVGGNCGSRLQGGGKYALRLSGDSLSMTSSWGCRPEPAVSISQDIEDCRLGVGGILTLAVCPEALRADGAWDHREYLFRFETASEAATFHGRLSKSCIEKISYPVVSASV